jgi:redox-sensitive bicupin YhaK (pirin superfamily)
MFIFRNKISLLFNKNFTNKMEKNLNLINLTKTWKSKQTKEGDGAILQRVIGIKEVDSIDPFLMLDHLESIRLPAGFPDHPHRGFETVTYMLKGKFYHEDFKGHKGYIEEGDVQWMTAGKGIVHSEIPFSRDEDSSGFQLWVNLYSKDKLIEPFYQEIKKDKIPQIAESGAVVKIIAGSYKGTEGPCKSKSSNISYFDIIMEKGASISFTIASGMNGFIYVYEGDDLTVQNEDKQVLNKYSAGSFKTSEAGELRLSSENGCKLLLIYGTPIGEKVAKYGPFVMNMSEELEQAMQDYQFCKNGFEGRDKWDSENKNLKYKK